MKVQFAGCGVQVAGASRLMTAQAQQIDAHEENQKVDEERRAIDLSKCKPSPLYFWTQQR